MSRKEDKKDKKEKKTDGDGTSTLVVSIDDFTRTRDSVIVGLAALQSAVSDLSRAYINHANTVLNRGPSTIDIGGLASSLLENGLFPPGTAGANTAPGTVDGDAAAGASTQAAGRTASPAARSVAGTKRKRIHDPNAPKRALTAYFLYMQHERANIAAELGENARPKEVADEGTRRWSEMSDADRQKWKQLYAENLAVYKQRMIAYKATLPPDHKVDTTVPTTTPKPAKTKAIKATKAAKTAKPASKPSDDHEAAQQLQLAVHEATEDTSSDSDSSDSESADATPTPSPPKPTPKSQKRRQSKAAAAAPAPVMETPTPAAKKASPEKKKAEKGKAKERRASAVVASSPVQEPPKSEKRPRKKRKSTAADE